MRYEGDATEGGQRRLALMVADEGDKSETPLEFTPGTTDVVLVLRRSGELTVDLSALSPEDLAGMRLALRSTANDSFTELLAPGKEVTFKGLLPGTYAVDLNLPPETVRVVDGLVVASGETLVDPRLNPLTLGAHVQWRTLFVTGPNGAPLQEITLGRSRAGERDRVARIRRRDGGFPVPAYLQTPPDSYWIEAEGCRRQSFERLRDGMTIELEGPIVVTLDLVGAPSPGEAFVLIARRAGGASVGRGLMAVEFNNAGRATLSLPTPGRYRLAKREGARLLASSPSASSPWWDATFEVPEEGGEIEVRAASTTAR